MTFHFFQFLKGDTVISFWKFWRVVLLLWGYCYIRHSGVYILFQNLLFSYPDMYSIDNSLI